MTNPAESPDPHQALLLLQLRLLIARAGQKDSLRWWDDDSLTAHGMYVLARTFPGKPALAGRSLALRAATLRHDSALAPLGSDVVHLFRLDKHGSDQLAMRTLRYVEIDNNNSPISDMDELRQRLMAITGGPADYERLGPFSEHGGLRIRLKRPATSLSDKAITLAWAYLEGSVGHPVLPYLMERP